MEHWKPIAGTGGVYDVSDQGNVRSYYTIGRPKKNGLLAQQKNPKGYRRVILWLPGKHYSIVTHRLVLQTFVGPPPSVLHQSNHKNGIKDDNRVENLEWVTPVQNNAHAVAHGWWHPHKGEAHGMAKLTEKQVYTIRSLQGHKTATELGKQFNVTSENIRGIWNRRLWKHLP